MKEVKDFYKSIPFYYTDDIDFYTNSITSINQIIEYKDLHQLLIKRRHIFGKQNINNVLEFGCGTGWLTNTMSYIYKKKVTSLDFTEKAIETAKLVSKALKVSPKYIKNDIFDYEDNKQYDLVISLGVLHHTKNCKLAFAKISNFVKPGGYLYVGLYHLYSRRPMLNFLQSFARWHGVNSAYQLFVSMSKNLKNPDHSFSWFRDQVLHPHETQHTLAEVRSWLDSTSFNLVSTSINKYKSLSKFKNVELDDIERNMEDLSYQSNVLDLNFNPGYFTICAKKAK